MCQKCTAPGPATASVYLMISQTVLSAPQREGWGVFCVCERESGELYTHVPHRAPLHQVLQLFWGPATTHRDTHTLYTTAHTWCCVWALWSVGFFALCFYLFQWFGNKHSHGSSAKRCHLGAILCHTPASTPASPLPRLRPGQFLALLIAWQIANSSGGSGANCLPCRQVFVFVFALQFLSLLFLFSHSLSCRVALLLFLFCQALTSDARFPRHRWPVSKRHCQYNVTHLRSAYIATLPLPPPLPATLPRGIRCQSLWTGNKNEWKYACSCEKCPIVNSNRRRQLKLFHFTGNTKEAEDRKSTEK